MKKILLSVVVILLVLILHNCELFMTTFYKGPDPIDVFTAKISKDIAKKYDLYFCGLGGGEKKGKVWLVDVSFDHKGKPINIEEGRRLIVKITEELLAAINSNEQIRDLMYEYPFTTKNVNVGIYFLDTQNNLIYHPYLTTILVFSEKLCAYTTGKENPNMFKSKTKENYFDALSIVENEENHKQNND